VLLNSLDILQSRKSEMNRYLLYGLHLAAPKTSPPAPEPARIQGRPLVTDLSGGIVESPLRESLWIPRSGESQTRLALTWVRQGSRDRRRVHPPKSSVFRVPFFFNGMNYSSGMLEGVFYVVWRDRYGSKTGVITLHENFN